MNTTEERRVEAADLLASGYLLNLTQAANIIGISKSTLSYRTRMGLSPRPVGRIGKVVVYWLSDALAERAARKREAS